MERKVFIESLGIVFNNAKLIGIRAEYICFEISEEEYSKFENGIALDDKTYISFMFNKVLIHHHTKNFKVFK